MVCVLAARWVGTDDYPNAVHCAVQQKFLIISWDVTKITWYQYVTNTSHLIENAVMQRIGVIQDVLHAARSGDGCIGAATGWPGRTRTLHGVEVHGRHTGAAKSPATRVHDRQQKSPWTHGLVRVRWW